MAARAGALHSRVVADPEPAGTKTRPEAATPAHRSPKKEGREGSWQREKDRKWVAVPNI
jgi:hypothetical protein